MEILFTSNALLALLTLTFLEIILGIDNIVFLSIVSGKLNAKDQPKARRIGLLLAMLFRIILLFGITWVLSLQDTLFSIDLGTVFCGESMFSKVPNASKVAFIYLAKQLEMANYKLLDCQVHNNHLESLGCIEIEREEFLAIMKS